MTRLFAFPGYARFWSADTVSTFGTYITTVALPTLAVVVLKASDTQVGLLATGDQAQLSISAL